VLCFRIEIFPYKLLAIYISGGRGHDLFVIGFITTYAISAYHN